jgi:hypothetical protein
MMQVKEALNQQPSPSLMQLSSKDELDVKYDEIELPKRFKKLLEDLDNAKQKELMFELIDALPFLPLKKLLKLCVRISHNDTM